MTYLLLIASGLLTRPLAARIPALAWVAIVIIVIFTLLINLILIGLLRGKTLAKKDMRQSRVSGLFGAAPDLTELGKVMRDPLGKERRQLDELSRLVHGLEDAPRVENAAPERHGAEAKPADETKNSPQSQQH